MCTAPGLNLKLQNIETMTYCEPTSKNEIALHCNNDEMALVFDLLNSITDPTAQKLAAAVENTIRNHGIFQIHRTEEIERCHNCQASGKIRASASPTSYEEIIEKCDKCKGEGQRIKITTWRYESIDENKRMKFAGYPRK